MKSASWKSPHEHPAQRVACGWSGRQALGTVEAEQFVAALTRDRFDYTEWRKTGLPDLDLETLSTQAAQYSRTLDN